jgi:hypothetical protein
MEDHTTRRSSLRVAALHPVALDEYIGSSIGRYYNT